MSLVGSSVAPATWAGHGKSWDEWMALLGDRTLPRDRETLLGITLSYMINLREKGVSASVAQRKLAGVRFHLLLRGRLDVTKDFIIRQSLKGWKKERVVRESRRPVSFSLLNKLLGILAELCVSAFEVALFRASFTLAFFGALRVGELVSPSRNRLGGLLPDDVVLANGAVRVRIRRSKTDIFGRGEWIPLHQVGGRACPVSAIEGYMAIRKEGPVFLVHEDGSVLTRFQFSAVFKRGLAAVGECPGEYGTHSFRIGAATEAARAGLSNLEVQRIGRWRSACFAGYVRPELLT